MTRWRGLLISSGKGAKVVLSFLLIFLGGVIVSGFDKHIETLLVDSSPRWLTNLTTQF